MPRKFHLKLLDDAPLLIWRANASGECDWFNATWLAFTGRSMDQELGSGWAAGVYPDRFERVPRVVQRGGRDTAAVRVGVSPAASRWRLSLDTGSRRSVLHD